jgi:hypothetical protein
LYDTASVAARSWLYDSAYVAAITFQFEDLSDIRVSDLRTVNCNRLDPSQVERVGQGYALKGQPGVSVTSRAHKMSKSRGNVVNPDDIVFNYGADSLRLYEMFMGPLRESKVPPPPLNSFIHPLQSSRNPKTFL